MCSNPVYMPFPFPLPFTVLVRSEYPSSLDDVQARLAHHSRRVAAASPEGACPLDWAGTAVHNRLPTALHLSISTHHQREDDPLASRSGSQVHHRSTTGVTSSRANAGTGRR